VGWSAAFATQQRRQQQKWGIKRQISAGGKHDSGVGSGRDNTSLCGHGSSRGNHLGCLAALTEAILESARHVAEVAHATGACGASPLALDRPVEDALAGSRVAARRARLLLDMVRRLAAAHTERVRLGSALSE
jgi:hypothetical protein